MHNCITQLKLCHHDHLPWLETACGKEQHAHVFICVEVSLKFSLVWNFMCPVIYGVPEFDKLLYITILSLLNGTFPKKLLFTHLSRNMQYSCRSALLLHINMHMRLTKSSWYFHINQSAMKWIRLSLFAQQPAKKC